MTILDITTLTTAMQFRVPLFLASSARSLLALRGLLVEASHVGDVRGVLHSEPLLLFIGGSFARPGGSEVPLAMSFGAPLKASWQCTWQCPLECHLRSAGNVPGSVPGNVFWSVA